MGSCSGGSVSQVADAFPPARGVAAVSVFDPLHRPLYILHPSLVIREYHGEGHDTAEVADLRHPTQTKVFAKKPCEGCPALP